MEARFGGENNQFYIAGTSNGLGKKSLEWDLNDWKWDGDLFVATPLNDLQSDCRRKQLFPPPAVVLLSNSSSSCSEETYLGITQKGKGELEKRRRTVVEEDDGPRDEDGSLTLKLGGHPFPAVESDLGKWEAKNEKRSNSNPATCQVEGCGADLRDAKDYHRRHKVCQMHAKATKAMVGNHLQRFCQQCSRFHLLEEFDEGKRSCRRRLAGHNKRRRKTQPDGNVSGSSLNEDQASSYLLIILKILANIHSDGSDRPKDQDLLLHLLRNIASLGSSSDGSNLSGLLQASQAIHQLGTAVKSPEALHRLLSNGLSTQEPSMPLYSPSEPAFITATQGSLRPTDNHVSVSVTEMAMPSERNTIEVSLSDAMQSKASHRSAALASIKGTLPPVSAVESVQLKDFDLNSTYNDPQDFDNSSPPQTSGNTDSTCAHSLCNSNGGTQSRTDRIVFKLFGKGPSDFPLSLKGQVLDWLSHSPTEIESYIRPGCVVLTVYLRLPDSAWEKLSRDIGSSLSRLLFTPDDDFWRTGWIYARIQHRMALIYDGQVLVDTPLLLENRDHCSILSISPIAAPTSGRVKFTVKGFNLGRPTVRLLCAFEGRYIVSETSEALVEGIDASKEHDGSHCCTFYCSLPDSVGRGFIEVENDGLSSGFFPFVVAEEDVCSEIRMLESTIEVVPSDDFSEGNSDAMHARNQAMDFLHEMGWLLRRSRLRSRYGQMTTSLDDFPLSRFSWLMAFALDQEWCTVVKKLLNVLFQENIGLGRQSPAEICLSEDLLHRAVWKNCRPMVELLLKYTPDVASKKKGPDGFLFKPDTLGPSNITPLHIVASISGTEGVLDALTDDPGQLGIKAWSSIRDSTGFTPEDYARSQGFKLYIDLVQNKIKKKSDKDHVVLNIPYNLVALGASRKVTGFQIAVKSKQGILVQQPCCKICDQKQVHRTYGSRSMLYRPLMLSLVGIAAVCVCVGLLLKGPPEVDYIDSPFRWESLDFGWI